MIRKNKDGKIFTKKSSRALSRMHENRFSVYTEKNIPAMHRVKKAALQASDNGRCWWIYQYIIGTGH
tara:strand:- start:2154 stop:2354 length:201 start_codon:yes stop_codon:yes gene_type:complete